MPASASEIAWAAGLFEGEGTFVAATRRDRIYLRAVVELTDRDVLERWRSALDIVPEVRPVRRTASVHLGRKPMYRVETSGAEALRIAGLLRPWLGERRRARLEEITALVDANPPTQYGTGWVKRRALYGPNGRSA